MKNSQQDLINAVLTIATTLGIEKNYTVIINDHIGLPKLTEMIIYQMFINNQILTDGVLTNGKLDSNIIEAKQLILEYCQELQAKGFVNFEK